MASIIETPSNVEASLQNHTGQFELIKLAYNLGLSIDDLDHIEELSPYLILDGHRTGISDHEDKPSRGYVEGAIFSMRFAKILKELGGKQATFLIHTLRNYETMDRMKAIFDAVGDIGKKFIKNAIEDDICLKYYGYEVHDNYALADIINTAEMATTSCKSFKLNFLTNYSEEWAAENTDMIDDLPEITVIGRFTKGHYSGVGIPGHAGRANFMYIQQASVSENWKDEQIIMLILSLLKSHLALKGFVGGKSYQEDERDEIRKKRELQLYEDSISISSKPSKRIISFSPSGPMKIEF